MSKTLAALVVLFAVSSAALASPIPIEIVVNGNFDTVTTWSSLPIANCPPWTGMTGTINSYDVASVAEHTWYATTNSYNGLNGQRAQQNLTGVTADTQYTMSADLRAWTDDSGTTATAEVRLYFYNSSLGAGWQYLPEATVSYTASTSADIANFHHITAEFELPADFNLGSDRPVVALWGLTDGGIYSAGWAWDNVSLVGTTNVPEPATMAFLAAGGVGVLLRRRRRA